MKMPPCAPSKKAVWVWSSPWTEMTGVQVCCKLRAIELGFITAIGVLNYADGHYLPNFSFNPQALNKDETFIIDDRMLGFHTDGSLFAFTRCTSVSSYSPFSVSVTSADSGDRVPLPLVEKSGQSAG